VVERAKKTLGDERAILSAEEESYTLKEKSEGWGRRKLEGESLASDHREKYAKNMCQNQNGLAQSGRIKSRRQKPNEEGKLG